MPTQPLVTGATVFFQPQGDIDYSLCTLGQLLHLYIDEAPERLNDFNAAIAAFAAKKDVDFYEDVYPFLEHAVRFGKIIFTKACLGAFAPRLFAQVRKADYDRFEDTDWGNIAAAVDKAGMSKELAQFVQDPETNKKAIQKMRELMLYTIRNNEYETVRFLCETFANGHFIDSFLTDRELRYLLDPPFDSRREYVPNHRRSRKNTALTMITFLLKTCADNIGNSQQATFEPDEACRLANALQLLRDSTAFDDVGGEFECIDSNKLNEPGLVKLHELVKELEAIFRRTSKDALNSSAASGKIALWIDINTQKIRILAVATQIEQLHAAYSSTKTELESLSFHRPLNPHFISKMRCNNTLALAFIDRIFTDVRQNDKKLQYLDQLGNNIYGYSIISHILDSAIKRSNIQILEYMFDRKDLLRYRRYLNQSLPDDMPGKFQQLAIRTQNLTLFTHSVQLKPLYLRDFVLVEADTTSVLKQVVDTGKHAMTVVLLQQLLEKIDHYTERSWGRYIFAAPEPSPPFGREKFAMDTLKRNISPVQVNALIDLITRPEVSTDLDNSTQNKLLLKLLDIRMEFINNFSRRLRGKRKQDVDGLNTRIDALYAQDLDQPIDSTLIKRLSDQMEPQLRAIGSEYKKRDRDSTFELMSSLATDPGSGSPPKTTVEIIPTGASSSSSLVVSTSGAGPSGSSAANEDDSRPSKRQRR